jgi:hypothetical protein
VYPASFFTRRARSTKQPQVTPFRTSRQSRLLQKLPRYMQLAVDPHGTPSPSATGIGVTDYAELSGAVWFGLPICDPNSFPTIGGVRSDPCTPDSDTNTTATAGSAFMESQIYPPGFAPFLDAPSCDSTHYCTALNIDSAEVIQNNGAPEYNPNCMEPRNFAFLQRNGIPAGPPSPQLVDVSSFTVSCSIDK